MHKLTAIHKFVKGRPVWEVNVPLSVCGKRVRLSRLTEREALAAANQWVVENQRFGTEHSDLTTAERAFVMHLREKKIPLRDAAKAAEKTARKSVPLLRALNEYMRTQVGNSKSHLQSLKNYYTRFAREFPHRDIAEITSADIAGYLFAHKSNERQIYGRLRQFFRWCVMMDYVERNPVERVPKPDPDNKERQVFTPDQMRALLKAASGTPVVLRYLVLGGFFGLRPSEVEKLRCEDIDLEHAETGTDSITLAANLPFNLTKGDKIYLMAPNGTILVGATTKELNAPTVFATAQGPLLIDLTGTAACRINIVAGEYR